MLSLLQYRRTLVYIQLVYLAGIPITYRYRYESLIG